MVKSNKNNIILLSIITRLKMQFSILRHMSSLLRTNNGGVLPHKFLAPKTKFSGAIQSTSSDKLYERTRSKREFTPIGESYTSLLRKLIQLRLVEPVNPYVVNPNARGFDPTVICEYHANSLGHNIENCWTLKRVIEKLI